jgi:hypothetical protein
VQGYPAEEVESVMRAGNAIWQPRFELYDYVGNLVDSNLQGVTRAKVEWDDTRDIKGSLELDLFADERLRTAFFRYIVKPYVGIGPMPSTGGLAEFPMGRYVWTRPKRIIEGVIPGASESWTITLGDLSHFLDAAGPGPYEPFIINAGGIVAWYVIGALYRAGFTTERDFSGLTQNETLAPNDAWYTHLTTARQNAAGEWRNEGVEKWLNILKDLHQILGWREPEFDNDGVYLGRPDRAWDTDPADVIYDTSDDGVMLEPTTVEPDLSKICNRVSGESDNPDTTAGFGGYTNYFTPSVDLNWYLPGHPLAQVNHGRYIDHDPPMKGSWASDGEAYDAVRVELFKSLAWFEKATLKRSGFLAQHESAPLIGVVIANDPEYGGIIPGGEMFGMVPPQLQVELSTATALFRETARTLDLFTGDGESTLTRLSRTQ